MKSLSGDGGLFYDYIIEKVFEGIIILSAWVN